MKLEFFIIFSLISYGFSLFSEILGHFKSDDKVKITAGRITSTKTQIPFNLHSALNCKGDQGKKTPIETNIGEILMGDRIYETNYKVKILDDKYCQTLCSFEYDNYHENYLKFLIENNYLASYYLDGLPASYINLSESKILYNGIPLGYKISDSQYILYNHYSFHIELQREDNFLDKSLNKLWNKDEFMINDAYNVDSNEDNLENAKFSIRKFQVTPFSIDHNENEAKCFSNSTNYEEIKSTLTQENIRLNYSLYFNQTQSLDNQTNFPEINSNKNLDFFKDSILLNYFNKKYTINSNKKTLLTYDIKFTISKKQTKYVSRWDHYLKQDETSNDIHWWSMINSIIAILISSLTVMTIFYRVIRKDIDYISLSSFDTFDEAGWKQVSGSAFLPPKNRYIFCAFTGTGIQLFFVLLTVLIFCLFGFSHPRYRGTLISLAFMLFIIFGLVSGYVSSRLFKLFIFHHNVVNPNKEKPSWLINLLVTSILIPLIIFSILLSINTFLIYEKSSAVLELKNILNFMILWIFCSSPMTILGGFIGIKQDDIKLPCKINKVPDIVPQQPFYLSSKVIWIFSGAIPFS